MVAVLSQQAESLWLHMNVQPKMYRFTEVTLNCTKHFISLGEDRNVSVLTIAVT